MSCSFKKSLVVGFLVIVQYSDPSNPSHLNDVGVASTRNIDSFVVVDGFANGLHRVTVFPLLETTNLVFSRAVYENIVELFGFSDGTFSTTGSMTSE